MKIMKNQRGDTIVEVLISVAVLSLVLTTTFALANRNSQANRQAAERGEALKIAQSEMERLKFYLSSTGVDIPAPGSNFCMKLSGTEIVTLTGTLPTDPNSDKNLSNTAIYSSQCQDGVGSLYYRVVQRGAGSNSNTYTAYVRWQAVTGNGVDQVAVVHKLYPGVSLILNLPSKKLSIAKSYSALNSSGKS